MPSDPKGTVRAGLAAIVEAMRAGFGPDRVDPQTLADAGHDPTFIERAAPVLEFLYGKYFRVRTLGIENFPRTGAALLVANHSGGLPYDGAMLIYGIFRDHPAHRRLRTLVANFAFRSPWMVNVVARIGGVRASTETAMPLLESGNHRRRRGDPPTARQDHLAGRAPRDPLYPDYAHVSPPWTPGAAARAHEVDHPLRRPHPLSAHDRRRAGPPRHLD